MKRRKAQGFVHWIVAGTLACLVTFFIFIVSPVYSQHFFMARTLSLAIQYGDFHLLNDEEILMRLAERIQRSGLPLPPPGAVRIERQAHQLTVTVDYEDRVHYLPTLDVVISFKRQYTLMLP